MLTLALDAAAGDATVAVFEGSELLAAAESPLRDRSVERLLPTVIAALDAAGSSVSAVQRVVCGDGPGGFTALRLAGAAAKGIVRGTGAEFWVVSSLALIVAAAEPPLTARDYLALLDALRGECYAALVTVVADGRVTSVDPYRRMTREAALEYAMTEHLIPVGPSEALPLRPHARGLARVAWHGSLVRRVDPAAWEPDYGRLAEAQVRWEAAHQRALQSDIRTR
jgi:tRNA threonylcarbamoyladenosine biosynthesis protein TsaB